MQMLAEFTVTVGFAITVTSAVAVFTQPALLVPVIVYTVVTDGDAETVAPVDPLRLIAGDHV